MIEEAECTAVHEHFSIISHAASPTRSRPSGLEQHAAADGAVHVLQLLQRQVGVIGDDVDHHAADLVGGLVGANSETFANPRSVFPIHASFHLNEGKCSELDE